MPLTSVNEPPAGSKIFPTVEDLRWFDKIRREDSYDGVSIDIENAGPHIICCGFTLVDLQVGTIGPTICVRFRRRGGQLFYSNRSELVRVVEWMYRILADSSLGKVFHNGVVYDVPILQRLGFKVNGRLIDTMNLAHACYPELSKGLQFTATLYMWAPVWKTLVDETDEGDGKG